MKPIHYSLYLVTDRELTQGRPLMEVVESAVEGGVTVVQLREKKLGGRLFLAQARRLKERLAPRGIPLIINDRIDIALAADADGVHLGQEDLPLGVARRLLGPDRLIGISAHTAEEIGAAAAGGADYVGVGPVFPTATKTDTREVLGVEGLRRLREGTDLPLVGIGGIGLEQARAVIEAGADGVAVVSALVGASDPTQAARELWTQIQKGRPQDRTESP